MADWMTKMKGKWKRRLLSLGLCSAVSKVMFVQDLKKQAGAQVSATWWDAPSFQHPWEVTRKTAVQLEGVAQRFVPWRVFRNMLGWPDIGYWASTSPSTLLAKTVVSEKANGAWCGYLIELLTEYVVGGFPLRWLSTAVSAGGTLGWGKSCVTLGHKCCKRPIYQFSWMGGDGRSGYRVIFLGFHSSHVAS